MQEKLFNAENGETIWQKNKVSGTPQSFGNRRWIRFASSIRA
jgi:hypothetical protein